MDIAAILCEVGSWPPEERIRLLEALWESIRETEGERGLTEAQKTDLDRRLAALEADREDVVSWEAVQAQLRRPK